MLTGKLIHPDILAALALCGHGDKVLIADGNYPLDSKSGEAETVTEAPAQETTVNETPAQEEAPVEEAPAEEAPVEETPVENTEAPAEENNVG